MRLNFCRYFSRILVCLFGCILAFNAAAQDYSAQFRSRPSQLKSENVAVVINTQDANSVEVGNYYMAARQIPAKNLVKLSFKNSQHYSLHPDELKAFKQKITAKLSEDIQVILLVWTTPYAVGCNSITSALTLGYDANVCEGTCPVGKNSVFFNSRSFNPLRDHQIRLTMLLPTDDLAVAKAVIDRGVLSGFALNDATGYFLKTSDVSRSRPREPFFPPDLSQVSSKKIHFRTIRDEHLRDKKDVMFYFTGQERVQYLSTLNFMPGAIADHLTSVGGAIDHDYQMRATEWLQAGATGSYGSVSEPCNHWQKFPNPKVLLNHYLAGETLVEAYWKSVKWPAQGLFIGEPLAAPYKLSVMPSKAPEKVEEKSPEDDAPTEIQESTPKQ